MNPVKEYIEVRENVGGKVTDYLIALYTQSLVYYGIFSTYMATFYNYCKLRVYDYLDVVGYRDVLGVYCLYYRYNGHRYLIPVPRTRGPTPENEALSRYFENDPELMHEFMGPRGDWHGRMDMLIKELNA